MIIRALRTDDVDQIRRLAEQSREEGFTFLVRMLGDLESGQLSLDDTQQFFLGVFEHDELLAVGGVTPDPYVDRTDTGRIRHVFVKQSERRGGIGRFLLAALEERACRQFDILRLRTDTTAAARFYERIGYDVTSEADATHRRRCERVDD